MLFVLEVSPFDPQQLLQWHCAKGRAESIEVDPVLHTEDPFGLLLGHTVVLLGAQGLQEDGLSSKAKDTSFFRTMLVLKSFSWHGVLNVGQWTGTWMCFQ